MEKVKEEHALLKLNNKKQNQTQRQILPPKIKPHDIKRKNHVDLEANPHVISPGFDPKFKRASMLKYRSNHQSEIRPTNLAVNQNEDFLVL